MCWLSKIISFWKEMPEDSLFSIKWAMNKKTYCWHLDEAVQDRDLVREESKRFRVVCERTKNVGPTRCNGSPVLIPTTESSSKNSDYHCDNADATFNTLCVHAP